MKSKYTIEYSDEAIEIQENGETVLYWHVSEWKEDPQVAFSIFHSIELAMKNEL